MRILMTALVLVLLHIQSKAQAPTITFQSQGITGLSAPIDMVSSGDGSGRMFIVEQGGMIKIWTGGTTTTNFLNVGPTGLNLILTGGEQGLLSMAFHPDYDGVTNLYFYIYYTNLAGNIAVSRFSTVANTPTVVNTGSQLDIIAISHPGQTNHNGGKLNFGTDGYLYFATGDGGGGGDLPNNAQTGTSLLGKMLRIDVDNPSVTYGPYSVPADNPYLSDAAVDDRIYALGLRNPFRWSFDRSNGNIWIGDVGQGAWEEVNFRSAADAAGGTNYGWRCYEGNAAYNTAGCLPQASYAGPAFVYANGPGSAAVTGGYVYRGPDYPNFWGYYIASDVYSGNVYIAWPNGTGFSSSVQPGVTGIVGYSEADDGTLYALSIFSNAVYQVVATGGTALPVQLKRFSVAHQPSFNTLSWTTAHEENLERFVVEYSEDGAAYKTAGHVPAMNNLDGASYTFHHNYAATQTMYYRLRMEEIDGGFHYSNMLKVAMEKESMVKITPTFVTNGTIRIESGEAVRKIELVNASGAVVYQRAGEGNRSLYLTLPGLVKGVYWVRVICGEHVRSEKIYIP